MNCRAAFAAASVCSIPVSAFGQSATALPRTTSAEWPKINIQYGRYFSYPVPLGWVQQESTNGVDVTDPQEFAGYNFVGLEGTPGSITPRGHIERVLGWAKATNVRIVSTTNRPTQNGFETAEFIFSYVNGKGIPMTGWAWTAVNNSFGRNNTYCELAWATNALWAVDQQFLVGAARLVQITNVQQAFQRDQLIRAGTPAGPGSAGGFNHPNTFTPYSNQAAMDRISANRAISNRGVTPLVDPSTGRSYTGTWDSYNQVQGGWVNPQDPTQLLTVVRPPGGPPI